MTLERNVRTLHAIEKDKKTPIDRFAILNKEVAMVGYELLKAKVFPQDANAYLANARLELGDAFVQMIMLCYDLNLIPRDILKLGIQHTWERFQDFEEQGWDNNDKRR